MAITKETLRIWQWNCRGYSKKRHNLQMLVACMETPPSVIAVQEAGATTKLQGYRAFQCPANPHTAILVQRNIPSERSQFDSIDIPHDLIVLYPVQRNASRLYILNVYSSPKAIGNNFNRLFSLAKQAAQHHALLIVGDFNAPHTAWGYPRCTKKGRLLWECIQALRLTVQSDP